MKFGSPAECINQAELKAGILGLFDELETAKTFLSSLISPKLQAVKGTGILFATTSQALSNDETLNPTPSCKS